MITGLSSWLFFPPPLAPEVRTRWLCSWCLGESFLRAGLELVFRWATQAAGLNAALAASKADVVAAGILEPLLLRPGPIRHTWWLWVVRAAAHWVHTGGWRGNPAAAHSAAALLMSLLVSLVLELHQRRWFLKVVAQK